jgi:hypothetical protein
MVLYKVLLKTDNTSQTYNHQYSLDLNLDQENNPDRIFTETTRQKIRLDLQNQSGCIVSNQALERLIKTWTQDIREGYRDTYLTIDLPSLLLTELINLEEPGYQEIPLPIAPDLSLADPKVGMLPPLKFS